jgi:hypothetical protein
MMEQEEKKNTKRGKENKNTKKGANQMQQKAQSGWNHIGKT